MVWVCGSMCMCVLRVAGPPADGGDKHKHGIENEDEAGVCCDCDMCMVCVHASYLVSQLGADGWLRRLMVVTKTSMVLRTRTRLVCIVIVICAWYVYMRLTSCARAVRTAGFAG